MCIKHPGNTSVLTLLHFSITLHCLYMTKPALGPGVDRLTPLIHRNKIKPVRKSQSAAKTNPAWQTVGFSVLRLPVHSINLDKELHFWIVISTKLIEVGPSLILGSIFSQFLNEVCSRHRTELCISGEKFDSYSVRLLRVK